MTSHDEVVKKDSNWAHHASMSQHVAKELASICFERGSTKPGSVGYDVQGATVAPFTATATTVAPSPEISKASAGGLVQNWPNYDPQAYYAQVFQNSFPVTEIGNDAKENSVVDTGPAVSLGNANITATRGATSLFAALNLEGDSRRAIAEKAERAMKTCLSEQRPTTPTTTGVVHIKLERDWRNLMKQKRSIEM